MPVSSTRRRSLVPLLLVLLSALLVDAVPARAAGSPAASSLVASATSGLQDGAAVTLTAGGQRPGRSLQVYQCRGDRYPVGSSLDHLVPVGRHRVDRRDADCDPDQPNSKLDNSGRSVLGVADTSGQMTIVFNVRAGTLASQRNDVDSNLVDVSFTCDATSPCSLVVEDPYTGKITQSVRLTFAPSARVGCGASGPATVSGAGPFSMSGTYGRWAAGSCRRGDPSPLLADYTDTGEYAGLGNFQSGLSDFAFSGTGFAPGGGSPVPGTRDAVFTPVAAQAAVIAFDGTYLVQDPLTLNVAGVPLTSLDMTMAEVARLFGSGRSATAAQDPELVARNPLLKRIQGSGDNTSSLVTPDGALSTPDATTLAMTRAWAALPDSPWTHGVQRAFPVSLAGKGRGVVQIPLLSTLPALRTQVLGSLWAGSAVPANQVFLYLTDSATAAELGLHTVRLQNAAGAFVAPTPASVAAALSHVRVAADGTVAPEPDPAAAKDPAAYPLPLVQYAVSPRVDFPQPHKRERLVQFLRYAVTTGQGRDLAAGVFPLPATLRAAAEATLPQVGSRPAPPAAPAPAPPAVPVPRAAAPLAGPAPAVPRAAAPLRTGRGLPAAPSTGRVPVPARPVAGRATTARAVAAKPGATPPASPTVPAFRLAAGSTASRLQAPVGLALLALLISGTAYVTSGRRRTVPATGPAADGTPGPSPADSPDS